MPQPEHKFIIIFIGDLALIPGSVYCLDFVYVQDFHVVPPIESKPIKKHLRAKWQ